MWVLQIKQDSTLRWNSAAKKYLEFSTGKCDTHNRNFTGEYGTLTAKSPFLLWVQKITYAPHHLMQLATRKQKL
ncbi:hypothetical protein KC19_10G179900 [Ceratodon purpureus]|uniref:Uncharacterized protein n=1 Tax=Ceratodon purpureus TaxID=3225 RepID=A0A8T0GLK7_CERPU|nr:hypothetical protein KC19_10G179900 [Ceratodon purpureus]